MGSANSCSQRMEVCGASHPLTVLVLLLLAAALLTCVCVSQRQEDQLFKCQLSMESSSLVRVQRGTMRTECVRPTIMRLRWPRTSGCSHPSSLLLADGCARMCVRDNRRSSVAR